MATFFQDVRYGLRMLWKSPGFTAVAILTLALGIGANTAVFSLTDQVLLRSLPISHPEQLVELVSPGPQPGRGWSDGIQGSSFSYPMYKDLRNSTAGAFTGLLATFPATVDVAGMGVSERVPVELVSGNYFAVLGVTPALGRVFSSYDETAPGANPVVVLSYGFWQQHFGRDPSVLNKTLDVNGTSLTIVGVARKGYEGVQIGASPGLFVPITMKTQLDPNREKLDDRKDHWAQVLARLKPGFSTKRAEAAIAPGYHALLESELPVYSFMTANDQKKFVAKPLLLIRASQGRPVIQQSIEPPLLTLMIMVGLVLLIACANLASLLAARGEMRQREIAVRLALGASRLRLIRQLLTEGMVLSLAGCIGGLLFASWTLGLLVAALNSGMQVLGLHAGLDYRVLFFAVGISAFATILFALAPALHSTRMDLQSSLKEHGAGAGGSAASVRLRQLLIVSQVALTAVLLTASGLLVKSLLNLDRTNLGMNVTHVLQFSISPALNQYTPERSAQLFDHLRSAIGQLPGVRSVAMAMVPLFENSDWDGTLTAQGYTPSPDETPFAQLNSVSPGFFSAMGIPLLSGREFTDADASAGPPVAIVNETFARKFFARQNPVGLRVWFGKGKGIQQPGFEVVGVVQDSKYDNVRQKILPFMYFPYRQTASPKAFVPLGFGTFYIRTRQDPAALTSEVRNTIDTFDPHLPIYDVRTLNEQVEQSMFSDRMMTFLSVALGSLAALLAALGLYGVMAYIIVRRTREIGIRMALGAQRTDVLRMVLLQGGKLALIGLIAGVILAAATARYLASQLFGVSAYDPFIFVAAAALLMAIALAACWLPARRATLLDPMSALRHE
jgi:putative ABC transport system permease protein